MKKTINLTTAILIGLALLASCKKKESASTNTASATTTGPASHVNVMTAKVNNADWAMATNGNYSATYISKVFNQYSFGGQSSFSNPYTTLNLSFTYTTGIYNLGGAFANFSAKYRDSTNTTYTSRTGTINITTLDTVSSNQSIINKFKATFSFSTDTINNKSYIISNGMVDYQN